MVRIRRASVSDKDFLLEMRNEPHVVKTCPSKNRISKEEHERWYAEVLSRPDRYSIFVVCIGDDCGGYVRFYREDRKSCYVSIALKSKFTKQGRGELALALSTADLPWEEVEFIFAEIRKDNIASQLFFSKCGYELIGERQVIKPDALLVYRKVL